MSNDRRGQTLYIVAYDSSSDKRRTKVHRTLCGFGSWTQYSLFEVWLSRAQLLDLQIKLRKHLDPQHDSVRFYPVCGACRTGVITVGSAAPRTPDSFIV